MRSSEFQLVLTMLVVACDAGLVCRDEQAAQVDWFTMYKLPRLKKATEELIQAGLGYVYITSTESKNWIFANGNVSSDSSPPANSLRPLYDQPEHNDFIYVFYNDEHPNGTTSFTLGHTKGVVAFDGESGFWLVHSVPHYPPAPHTRYAYPHSGEVFGQSFMCVSLSSEVVEKVAQQLIFNQPYIYSSRIPDRWRKTYPIMSRVIDKSFRRKSPWQNVVLLKSVSGRDFFSFAKSGQFHKELYADLLAPYLKANLLVETWRNGPQQDQIASNCSGAFSVKNVVNLTLLAINRKQGGVVDVSFHFSHDHSKWAVSSDEKQPWVCVGDINRMSTQLVRGGGTMCHQDHSLWTIFAKTVEDVEPCSPTGADQSYSGVWT